MGLAAGDADLYRYVGNAATNLCDPFGDQSAPPDLPGQPLPKDYATQMNKAMQAYQDLMKKAQLEDSSSWQAAYKSMQQVADNARLITNEQMREMTKENAAYSAAYKVLLVKQEFFQGQGANDQFRMMMLFHETMHKQTEESAKDQMVWEIRAWNATMQLYAIYREEMQKGFKGMEAYFRNTRKVKRHSEHTSGSSTRMSIATRTEGNPPNNTSKPIDHSTDCTWAIRHQA